MNSESSSPKVSIGGILSDSWKVFQGRFQDIAIAALAVSVPVNVILAFLPQQDPEAGFVDVYAIGAAVGFALLAGLAGTIAVLATMLIAEKAQQGENVTWEAALRHGLSRWFASFWTNLLAGIMLVGLFLLLIVPGAIFAVYWSFVMAAVGLRSMEGMAAIRYSKSLVKGRWWKTFGYLIVFGLLGALCGGIVGGLFGMFPVSRVTQIVSNSVVSLIAAFFNVVSTIFFLRFEANRTEEAAVPAEVA